MNSILILYVSKLTLVQKDVQSQIQKGILKGSRETEQKIKERERRNRSSANERMNGNECEMGDKKKMKDFAIYFASR